MKAGDRVRSGSTQMTVVAVAGEFCWLRSVASTAVGGGVYLTADWAVIKPEPWRPKAGDQVLNSHRYNGAGEVLATHRDWAWIFADGLHYGAHFSSLRPAPARCETCGHIKEES